MVKPNVLVVDNDNDFRNAFSQNVIEPAGYTVFEANGPQAARAILQKHLIHLVIVDLRLTNDHNPNDTSGLNLCREIDPMIARIILTAFPEDWRIVREALSPCDNRERLADGFLDKNEEPTKRLEEIERVLRQEFEIIPEYRIAVLTSGGDSPGMNAAIWSIVRTAMRYNIEVVGIQDGYRGLVENRTYKLTWNHVSDIMLQGGTILGTARFPEFVDIKVREMAINNIVEKKISGLIVIGGDGSMNGARSLADDLIAQGESLVTVAIPGTIDNDLWGTDLSLGTSSAANAMVEELRNMIRPAQALRRIFIVEVMGAYCGYLALQAAIGIGADVVIIPEQIVETAAEYMSDPINSWKKWIDIGRTKHNLETYLDESAEVLKCAFSAGKGYGFVIVSEGIRKLKSLGNLGEDEDYLMYMRRYLENSFNNWECRVKPSIRVQELGYPVRGVSPTLFDVWLGAKLGEAAVQSFVDGETNVMVGLVNGMQFRKTSFDEVVAKSNLPPKEIWRNHPEWHELLELQETLSLPPLEQRW